MYEQKQINKQTGLVYQAKNKHAWQNDYLNNNNNNNDNNNNNNNNNNKLYSSVL